MQSTGLTPALSIVLLEDNVSDSEYLEALLQSEGFVFQLHRCDSEATFKQALSAGSPDLVISDYSLPSYDGRGAFALARALRPEVPFIFYSGTIGEESAIDALKEGATDYVLKQRPQRLVAAVRRAIEERDQRRRQLEAEEKIRMQANLIDLAGDAIMVLDRAGVIQFWNKGAERLYGFTADEAAGQPAADLLFRPPASAFHQAREAALRSGSWSGELEQFARDQRPITVGSRWTLVSEGNAWRMLTISTDISEHKQLQRQFLRAQRLESIGTLASGIAHDLNNILAPICMATDLLRAEPLSPGAVSLLQMIDQSARRGAEVVKQVLTFVRGSGSEGKKGNVSPGILLKELAKVAAETFPRNIRTRFQIAPDLWMIHADLNQLHQVLMNLCVNARDAMPDGGVLTLSGANDARDPAARRVTITVEDTGTGIPPEVLDKIFDPFFTTKALHHGTGLGLSTVLGIVKSHGGTIAVDSTPGAGSSFRISLPAVFGESAADRTPPGPAPRGHGELILTVDDEPQIRGVIGQILLSHGYEVIAAADGSEGVLRFREHRDRIRLVITDVMMPGVDGASFARTVRKLAPDLPIVATSGLQEKVAIPEARVLLKKPHSAEELLRTIAEVLREEPAAAA